MEPRDWKRAPALIAPVIALLLATPSLAEEYRQITAPTLELNNGTDVTAIQRILSRRNFGDQAVKITDLDGRSLTRTPVLPGEQTINPALPALNTNQLSSQFIVRPADTISVQLTEEAIDLPGGVAVGSTDRPDSGGWFQPTLAASPTPAVWDNTLNQYRMRLSLGLRGDNLPANAALQQPITVQFGFRGLIAEPLDAVTLQRSGIENEVHLEFLFLPIAETPVLELRSAITDIDYPIDAMPRIELRPVRDSITGLGLDEVLVRVLLLNPDGTAVQTGGNQTATVEVTTGSAVPEPSAFSLQGGDTQFMLRSQGLESATLRVTAGPLSDTVSIEQQFPTGPVLAALLGGALGGFSRRFTKQATNASSGARITEGLAVAIIAYVAGVLGVGYLGLPVAVVSTEAGAFLTGALTGFAGVTVIELLGKRVQHEK